MGEPLGTRLSRLAYRMLRHKHQVSGRHIDIHCGGDNAFPHHTNEIAQSEAYVGHK